jgi:hypothetical protein
MLPAPDTCEIGGAAQTAFVKIESRLRPKGTQWTAMANRIVSGRAEGNVFRPFDHYGFALSACS